MENKDVARIFDDIADILELKEANRFRIRSFRRVAQIIANLSFDALETVSSHPEKLRAISGIGEGTIQKLREIAETGSCAEHQELMAQIPPSLVTLLQLQHLGPRKIALLWESLGISNLEELEEAAKNHRLRDLPGIGAKSEEKILESIAAFRQSRGRSRLSDGIEISQSIIRFLREHSPVKRISEAGSVRRRCETIGDIDILVTTDSPGEVIESFVGHPEAREVLARGDTKASLLLRRGVQVDLRVLEDQSFGAALQYFTGSKSHNVALRERAKRMGYKISEYGLFRLEPGEPWIAGREEEEIYRRLGLDFIPPELRENRGEIEAAEKGTLPRLLQLSDIRGDLHMHTNATDGRDSIEDMARGALEWKHQYIAITDHSKALAMARGLDEEDLREHVRKIERIQAKYPDLTILKGIEVDILADGRLDLRDDALARLDIVIASIHSRFNLDRRAMTRRICRALENPHVNILAHPTGRLLIRREPYDIDLEEVIRAACANRVCLEINSYPYRLDLGDNHSRLALEMGALLSINSDSHSREMFRFIRYGVDTARRAWATAEDIINTYPLERLQRILRKEEYR